MCPNLPAGLREDLALPVDALDVLVHLRSQAVAAFRTAALENITATFRSHASTKAVNTGSPTNFGLICPFWHDSLTSMQFDDFLFELGPLLKGPSDYTVEREFVKV